MLLLNLNLSVPLDVCVGVQLQFCANPMIDQVNQREKRDACNSNLVNYCII